MSNLKQFQPPQEMMINNSNNFNEKWTQPIQHQHVNDTFNQIIHQGANVDTTRYNEEPYHKKENALKGKIEKDNICRC